ASVREWKPSERMLIAPLAYPKAIFAIATARLRTSTRTSTTETAPYRDLEPPCESVPRDRSRSVTKLDSGTASATSEHACRRHGPPPKLHFPDDVLLRHHAPM